MARKPTNSTSATDAQRPAKLLVAPDEANEKLQERITVGEQLRSGTITNQEDLSKMRQDESVWHDFNKEMLRRLFDSGAIAEEYADPGLVFGSIGYKRSLRDDVENFHQTVDKYIVKLRSIKERLALYEIAIPAQTPARQVDAPTSRKVFVVHGHDGELKQEVARLLEKLNIEPVILAEQPNGGRTVIEKFEAHSDVWFAVVLLTPDDMGNSKVSYHENKDAFHSRARQNVILELVYFIGKLGRANVCTLYKGDLELPSDTLGILYAPVDSGGWRLELGRELRQAGNRVGIEVDLNRL